jgi:hypothetical protein
MNARYGMNLRACTAPIAGLLMLTTLAWGWPTNVALARASAKACHRSWSAGDSQARTLARESEIAAEGIATEHHGFYSSVSPVSLHAFGPSIPISSSQARRARENAYLLSASGTRDAYVLTTRSLNGDRYTIQREGSGNIERRARVCGTVRDW